jgi:hypothetical protein
MALTTGDVLNYQIADRMPLFYLWRAIWRFCYDRKSCAFYHEIEMKKEIHKWKSIVDYQKKIKYEKFGVKKETGSLVDEIERQIEIMEDVLIFFETGIWNSTDIDRPFALDTVHIHNLDYRKIPMCIYFFPEVKKDLKKGQEALKTNMDENPQDYANGN